jgi:molecular chaperone GrpE (heat shock protein)
MRSTRRHLTLHAELLEQAGDATENRRRTNCNRAGRCEDAGCRERVTARSSVARLADAENARRQAERRVEDIRQLAVADFAREVLIVLDNLERTIAAARSETKNSLEHASLIEGVEATLRILVRTMERFGIRRIDALGQRFDPKPS